MQSIYTLFKVNLLKKQGSRIRPACINTIKRRKQQLSVFSSLNDSARKELWATLALRHARGIGARRTKLLHDAYGSAFAAVEAGLRSPSEWAQRKLTPPDVASGFASEHWREAAQKEWNDLRGSDRAFTLLGDPDFPAPLRHLPDPPPLLYMKGDTSLLRAPAVAVVGARDCTREGLAVAAYLAGDLSRAGVTVISGMARGIDRAAHLAALNGPGKSIAVLGSGIDQPYPQCNADLYAALAEQGLLLSEFPPGTLPAARHFPIRNRIISGLSQGVLVVEAAARSGSLITARLALEQGKEVFAVPGHTMAAVSAGCRELIRIGAKAVFNADDTLVELAPLLTATVKEQVKQRQGIERERKNQARDRNKEWDTGLLAEARDVLPEGDLPWLAPKTGPAPKSGPKTKRGKKSAPPPPSPDPKNQATGRSGKTSAPLPILSDEEQRIMAQLGETVIHIDTLCHKLGMDAGPLSGILTLLEVRGLVKRAPGMLYSLPLP